MKGNHSAYDRDVESSERLVDKADLRATTDMAKRDFECTVTTIGWTHSQIRTLGKFDLLEQVGTGAFGIVFKARDRELGRIVAIKMPRTGSTITEVETERMLREARSLANLQHRSIVPLFEICRESGIPYLVSEFVAGITLADLLTGERVTVDVAVELVAGIADALQHAHDHGVIHRDVKPSNIMLERVIDTSEKPSFRPRLMDFGLAKFSTNDATLTMDGQVLGTPAYMSPEQAKGLSHLVDGRSDVYSLGVILYQLLSGQLPFKGNAQLVLHQLIYDAPPSLRARVAWMPRSLDSICLMAMAKDPKSRYQSAGELASDLRRYLADEVVLARPPKSPARSLHLFCGKTAVALALLSVLVSFVVTSILWRSSKTNQPIDHDPLISVVSRLDSLDPSWRLEDLRSQRVKVTDEENGALQFTKFRASVAMIDQQGQLDGHWESPQVDDILEEIDGNSPGLELSEQLIETLRCELEKLTVPLDVARSMINFPDGRFCTVQSRDAVSTVLTEEAVGCHMANLLFIDGIVCLQKGNTTTAWSDFKAIWNVGRAYRDEPLPIAQLMRNACIRRALRLLEHILAYRSLTDDQLSEAQRNVAEAAEEPQFLLLVKSERAILHYYLSALATGDASINPFDASGIAQNALTTAEIRQAHAWLLGRLQEIVQIASQPSEQWMPSMEKLQLKPKDSGIRSNMLVQQWLQGDSMGPYLLKYAQGSLVHLADLRTAYVGIAAMRFHNAHGRWPESTDDLMAHSTLRLNPFDGSPLVLQATNRDIIVLCLQPDHRLASHKRGCVQFRITTPRRLPEAT